MNWREEIKNLEGWSFGDNAEMADELAQLVLADKKTATSSLFAAYQDENEPILQVGEKSFIKNSNGEPVCVIETKQVIVQKFKEADEDLAIAEGEGDLSLNYWRKAHINFFKKYNSDFNDDSQIVSEYFKVLHKF